MVEIITNYVIPAIAILMSFFFWVNGRDSAKRAEQLLDEITRTSRGWQKDIMDSANQMLNSRPEIAAHQMYMSKIEAATKISDSIKLLSSDIINNPKQGEESKVQWGTLKMLLDYQIHYFNFIVDGKDLPPKKPDDIQDNLNNVIQEKAQKHKQPKQKK